MSKYNAVVEVVLQKTTSQNTREQISILNMMWKNKKSRTNKEYRFRKMGKY